MFLRQLCMPISFLIIVTWVFLLAHNTFALTFMASASCHLLDTVTHSVSCCLHRMDGSFCRYRQQWSESANKRVACTPRLNLQFQCKSSKSLHSNRWSLFRFIFPEYFVNISFECYAVVVPLGHFRSCFQWEKVDDVLPNCDFVWKTVKLAS